MHMLQRVLLQYWQNVQSGQGFFFKTNLLSILLVYAPCCLKVKLKGIPPDRTFLLCLDIVFSLALTL